LAVLHPFSAKSGKGVNANSNERLLKFLQATPEQQAAIDRILEGKAEARTVAATGPLLLGMGAGAKFLGVSRATLWRMIQAGRLKKVEVLPGSFRVRRADLQALAGEGEGTQ
jgi:excisionase family DNA binding protein